MAVVSIRKDERGWYMHQTYTLGQYRLFAGVPEVIQDPAVIAHAKSIMSLLVDESPVSPAPEPIAEAPDAGVEDSTTEENKTWQQAASAPSKPDSAEASRTSRPDGVAPKDSARS